MKKVFNLFRSILKPTDLINLVEAGIISTQEARDEVERRYGIKLSK